MKDCKIRIESPEHSEAVQKWLFEQGVKWLSGSDDVDTTDAKFLYVEDDRITYGMSSWAFEIQEYLEELDTSSLKSMGKGEGMKITKDCYVNVEGWTEEEVRKAAEIFKEAIDSVDTIFDITVSPEYDYCYLHCLDKYVYVGDSDSLNNLGYTKELTKEQVLGRYQNPEDTLLNLIHQAKACKEAVEEANKAYEEVLEKIKGATPEGWEVVYKDGCSVNEDMTNPHNWREGDIVECLESRKGFTKYGLYEVSLWGETGKVLDNDGDVSIKKDDEGDPYFARSSTFKWHSCPN